MFTKGVLFDAWLFPLRYEAERLSSMSTYKDRPPFLFVNCERFQSAKNLETMSFFEHELPDDHGGQTNVLTLRGGMHYAPCDIPTVFMGSWARYPFSLLFKIPEPDVPSMADGPAPIPASKALDVCTDLALKFLKASSGDDDLQTYVGGINRYVIRGSDYLRKE
jgi:hypothetical protein